MVLSDRLGIIGSLASRVNMFVPAVLGAISSIMPIYVYKCTQCSEYCEALQKASDEPLKTCPHCQAEALTRVIAPVGVIFKGTGFHKNDYSGKSTSSSSAKPAAEGGSTGESQGEAKSEGKSESKAESKPATDSGGGSGGGGSDKVA